MVGGGSRSRLAGDFRLTNVRTALCAGKRNWQMKNSRSLMGSSSRRPGAGRFAVGRLGWPALDGELKVDLTFEAVHFRHLHHDIVTELKDAAGATSEELAASRVERVEIITQAG